MPVLVRPTGWVRSGMEPPPDPPDPPSGDFIADTLTAANTGIRSATTTTRGATTYTSANNGQTVNNTKFTGRTQLDGVSGMTFNDCSFEMQDYYPVWGKNGASNNQFNYCTFDGQYWNTGGVAGAFGVGIKYYRCQFFGSDHGVRLGANCEMRECLLHKNNLGIWESHTNGIAMFEGGDNILIEDCKAVCSYQLLGYSVTSNVCTITTDGKMWHCTNGAGAPISAVGLTIKVNTFDGIAAIDGTRTITAESGDTLSFAVSTADVAYTAIEGTVLPGNWQGNTPGGLTSSCTIITDFGGHNGVIARRNRFEGGSFAVYMPGNQGNGYTIRNVQFYENRISGGANGTATGTHVSDSTLYWYDNILDPNYDGVGSTVNMPQIGGERRP